MAKQNFLAGGYYGKLGATVGQRWRNKRTIRVYVKTPNPDTPLQRQNRGRFSEAIKASQTAMVFNKGTPAFFTEGLTEFQYRTSTAKQRIDAGLTGFAVIPFFPNNYTPSVTITDLTCEPYLGQMYKFNSALYPHADDPRNMIVSLSLKNDATDEYEDIRLSVTLETSASFLFGATLPNGYSIGSESKIYGVSTDDADYNSDMVYIPEQPISNASVVYLDDWQFEGWENQYLLLRSAKLSALATAVQMTLELIAYDPLTNGTPQLDLNATYNPAVDENVRVYLPDPYIVKDYVTVHGGTVNTQVPDVTVQIPMSQNPCTWQQRVWIGVDTELEIEYADSSTSEDTAYVNIDCNKGWSLANPNIAQFVGTYPYRDSGGTHTANLNATETAEQDALGGTYADTQLLVTYDYPEQAGDTMHFTKIGIGNQYYLYGYLNYNLSMQ